MAEKRIGTTYDLITSAADFIAQNRSGTMQEWVRAGSTPSESVKGIHIDPLQGMRGSDGSGSLYGRTRHAAGGGLVVFFT